MPSPSKSGASECAHTALPAATQPSFDEVACAPAHQQAVSDTQSQPTMAAQRQASPDTDAQPGLPIAPPLSLTCPAGLAIPLHNLRRLAKNNQT